MVVPDITIQTEDYAEARKRFHTKLLREGPAPHQQDCKNIRASGWSFGNQVCFWRIAAKGLVKPSTHAGYAQISCGVVLARRLLF